MRAREAAALLGEVAVVDHVEGALGGDPGVQAEEEHGADEADARAGARPARDTPRATASRRPQADHRGGRGDAARPRSGPAGEAGEQAAAAEVRRAPVDAPAHDEQREAAHEAEEERLRHRRGLQVQPAGVERAGPPSPPRPPSRSPVPRAAPRPEGQHAADEEREAQEAREQPRAVQAVDLARGAR